jgi:hypothetical protein
MKCQLFFHWTSLILHHLLRSYRSIWILYCHQISVIELQIFRPLDRDRIAYVWSTMINLVIFFFLHFIYYLIQPWLFYSFVWLKKHWLHRDHGSSVYLSETLEIDWLVSSWLVYFWMKSSLINIFNLNTFDEMRWKVKIKIDLEY